MQCHWLCFDNLNCSDTISQSNNAVRYCVEPACLKLLTNKDILKVHQDPAALAPRVIFSHQVNQTTTSKGGGKTVTTEQGFARTMHDGSVVLVLLNRRDSPGNATLAASWVELGLKPGAECAVRDLLGQSDLAKATAKFSASVGSHSAAAVRLTC